MILKGHLPWAAVSESRKFTSLVKNSHVPSPTPTPFYYILRRGVRVSAVESYCPHLALRNVGAETRLRARRRLPPLWRRRSKPALQPHGTFHSALWFSVRMCTTQEHLEGKSGSCLFGKTCTWRLLSKCYGMGEWVIFKGISILKDQNSIRLSQSFRDSKCN